MPRNSVIASRTSPFGGLLSSSCLHSPLSVHLREGTTPSPGPSSSKGDFQRAPFKTSNISPLQTVQNLSRYLDICLAPWLGFIQVTVARKTQGWPVGQWGAASDRDDGRLSFIPSSGARRRSVCLSVCTCVYVSVHTCVHASVHVPAQSKRCADVGDHGGRRGLGRPPGVLRSARCSPEL